MYSAESPWQAYVRVNLECKLVIEFTASVFSPPSSPPPLPPSVIPPCSFKNSSNAQTFFRYPAPPRRNDVKEKATKKHRVPKA